MIYIPEIIGRVIDDMREDGTYTTWSNVSTTYTIVSDNTLLEDEWILILDTETFGFPFQFPLLFTDDVIELVESDPTVFGQFQAVNVTSTSFDIVSEVAPPLVGGWKSLEPFYMFGHRREISNRLLMKDKDKVFKYQKYPLFALRLPISELVSNDMVHSVSLNMAILAFTDKNYRSAERYENIIKPVLVPLYEEFLEKVKDSSEMMIEGQPLHEKVDRLFYGISALEGNESYIFNDPLDGIELIDLELKVLNNNC